MTDIRELRAGDGEAVLALFGAVLDDFEPLADGVAGEFLADDRSFLLGAYLDGEPVGLAWGLQMRSPSGRLTTYLHELDVREQARRRGVATALVQQAMELARRRGSTRFWLSTGMHNEGAQALYESLGGDRKPLGDVNYWWALD